MNTQTTNTHEASINPTRTRAMLAAPILLALVVLGCGEQKRQVAAESGAGEPAAVETVTKNAAASTGAQGPATVQTHGGEGVLPTDALPPDVVATAPDTLAIPGSVVVLTALGSTDVTSVILTDGNGAKTPFIYDSESNLWRVSYRVPMRTTGERISLSVTASTEANRWKRVWVFLRVRGGEDESGC
jgi:hypothetical protein